MRDWDRLAPELPAANALLVVLTADEPAVAVASAARHRLDSRIASVDPSLWATWGLSNPKRSELPHPTTIVVGPDGVVQQRITHENYKQRADASAVLAAISAGAPPAPEVPATDEAPDWDTALTLTTTATPTGPRLSLQVASGFHVYGAKEQVARPLAVRVEGRPKARAPIPDGARKVLGEALGEAWVLEGTVVLDITKAGPAPWSGELDLQLCTDAVCSAPRTERWSAP